MVLGQDKIKTIHFPIVTKTNETPPRTSQICFRHQSSPLCGSGCVLPLHWAAVQCRYSTSKGRDITVIIALLSQLIEVSVQSGIAPKTTPLTQTN